MMISFAERGYRILRGVRSGGQPPQGREDGHKAVRGVSEAEVISRHISSGYVKQGVLLFRSVIEETLGKSLLKLSKSMAMPGEDVG